MRFLLDLLLKTLAVLFALSPAIFTTILIYQDIWFGFLYFTMFITVPLGLFFVAKIDEKLGD